MKKKIKAAIAAFIILQNLFENFQHYLKLSLLKYTNILNTKKYHFINKLPWFGDFSVKFEL